MQVGSFSFDGRRRPISGDDREPIRKVLPMTQHLPEATAGVDPGGESSGIDALSDREVEVLGLLGGALTTRQVADQLCLSVKTIETHRENIKAKLGLANNSEMIRRAVRVAAGGELKASEDAGSGPRSAGSRGARAA